MNFEQYTELTKSAFLFAIHAVYNYFRYFFVIVFMIIGISFAFLLLLALLFFVLFQDKLLMINEYLVEIKHTIHTAVESGAAVQSTVATMPVGALSAIFITSVACIMGGFLLYAMLNASYISIALNAIDKQEVSWHTIRASWRHTVSLALAGWLYHIACWIGFILLVLPGIWLMLALQFYAQCIMDKKVGIIDSLRSSFALTQSHILYLFIISLIVYPIEGLLSLFSGPLMVLVSLLLVAPFNTLFFTYIYRRFMQSFSISIIGR